MVRYSSAKLVFSPESKINSEGKSQIRKMIISAVLARAAVVSGGREVLMSRGAERCFFLD